jgi:hypothetical protein
VTSDSPGCHPLHNTPIKHETSRSYPSFPASEQANRSPNRTIRPRAPPPPPQETRKNEKTLNPAKYVASFGYNACFWYLGVRLFIFMQHSSKHVSLFFLHFQRGCLVKKETGLQKSRKITISCRRVQNFLRCGTKPSVGSTKKNKTKTHTSLKPQIKGKAESHLTPSLICQAGSLPVVN